MFSGYSLSTTNTTTTTIAAAATTTTTDTNVDSNNCMYILSDILTYVKYSLAHNMRQGKDSHCAVKKSDAPEEIDLWTAW